MNRNMIVVIGIGIAVVLVAIGYIGGYFSGGGDGADGKDVTDGGASREVYFKFLKIGEKISFKYAGHNISAEFDSSNKKHKIAISVDGEVKFIEKNYTDDPHGLSFEINNLKFFISPVERGYNEEGRSIPFFEKSWNTNEIKIQVWR